MFRNSAAILSSLTQQTPGRLVLITHQSGINDGAWSSSNDHFLSGLYLVTQVRQPALWVHLKLFLQGPTGNRREGNRERRYHRGGRVGSETGVQVPQHLFRWLIRSVERGDQLNRPQYLFLGCDPLLVPLPPGWVVDVEECFVSCGDSARSEELRTETRLNPGTSV